MLKVVNGIGERPEQKRYWKEGAAYKGCEVNANEARVNAPQETVKVSPNTLT